MKLKVCGMGENVLEVAGLLPDYLGFIFWEPSSRFFNLPLPDLNQNIEKVGVFVDASIGEILSKISLYDLQAIQLHGKESPQFCKSLKEEILERKLEINIIKVFQLKDSFNFDKLLPFERVCDFFLFDTKGKLPGGNGSQFNWSLLQNYPSKKPFFLSGGIGPNDLEKIDGFLKSPMAKYCYALDINSKFEKQPGVKKIAEIESFINKISAIHKN
ncbi:phosphoribosylanthranilate isomerase [Eudoraea chungangensis]|uniref:phosphoribosylanthranilate isomerase n=1 Tax=Eudoraea chungangensis TaxID=1481905 RepID=UPI0023EB7942|nr:phosphoribosylanthranilate isomerase [Eudoraea chungangensis]